MNQKQICSQCKREIIINKSKNIKIPEPFVCAWCREMADICDMRLIGGCNKKAKIYIEFDKEQRKLCLKHGINHLKLLLLTPRKRDFRIRRIK